MSRSEDKEQRHAVDDILSSIEVIDLASDTSRLEDWLQEEHQVSLSDDLLEGYEFFMETALRNLLHQVIYSTFPLIPEDFVFFRARFEGIELANIPNTCEKTKFVKNINDYRRQIRKASSWSETQTVLDNLDEDVVKPFHELFQGYTLADEDVNFDKEEVLRLKSIYNLYIQFNDVDDGYPNGYYITVLDTDLREERMETALEGYIFTLQFVWSQLTNDNTYQSTSISEMHDSEVWYHSIDLLQEDSGGIPDDCTDLDRFFGKLKEEVVRPLEVETGIKILTDILFLKEDVPDNYLEDLTNRDETVELTTQEEFDYQLLWYPVEFLQSSNIFNGVSAFISLLSGTVNLKFADGEKVYVCKFTHPVKPGNDYTYGVLVEASGSTGLADYSGWVMFYDCCGDYSGFAGSEHMQAETLIEQHLERDEIVLREMELKKDEFQELVSDKAIGERGSRLSEELDLESERNRLQRKVRRGRGLVVELISHYYLTERGHDSENVDWNVSLDEGELDVYVKTSEEIRLIECKYDPSNQNWENEFAKLDDKMAGISTEKDKQGEFWFWHSPPPETVSRLEANGFEYRVVSEMVRSAPEFRDKQLQHIQFVMEKADQNEQKTPKEGFKLEEL